MALEIPQAGLQLEEDYDDSLDHLPTQAFILDLNDDVIEGMIESVRQGNEIRLSLGNKPTFLYGPSSHHIEPSLEDDTDDLELFLTDATETADRAERLPQLAMSLFRKPELGNPWAQYRTSSDEEEFEEYEEEAYSDDAEDVAEHQSYNDLDSDIALLRNSLAQKEAEKIEKSARVIEGNAPAQSGKHSSKRAVGSLQKALSGRRSPFGRASVSPMPASPSLSAIGSPALVASDTASLQTADKAKLSRSPIIHELAFKEQPYDILWQKYPGASEAEFKNSLEKVADLDEDTQNYVLRKKYWKELDVWNHDYASDDERQQAIDNAVRTFDKMRLSTAEPEWQKLLPVEERGQGRILSKVQVSIAKGPTPKIRVQKADESSQDSGSGGGASGKDDSGDNGNTSSHDGPVSGSAAASPSRPATSTKKKMTAREAQEKRLLSTKKKTNTPASGGSSSTKVSPTKAAVAKANAEKQSKFKSKEFISDSDSSDSETESAPLSTSVHQSKFSAATVKTSAAVKSASKVLSASPRVGDKKEASKARQSNPPPAKDSVRSQITAKPLPKKRPREYEEDDSSSSSSSSGAPLSKRIKPVPKVLPPKDRRKDEQPRRQQKPAAPARVLDGSPHGSSSSGSSGHGGSAHANGSSSNRPKNSNGNSNGNGNGNNNSNSNNSPIKSSPLASSPPTNASELDLSSEESVPPISTGSTNKMRKLAEERRNKFSGMDSSSDSSKIKKRKHLPTDLVNKALLFKVYYEKYEALYKDIASRANPPKDKVNDLLAMHNRLQEMKSDIHSEATARA